MNKIFNILAVLIVLLYSCSDDKDDILKDTSLDLRCNTSVISTCARFHTLRIEGIPQGTGSYIAEIRDDWARAVRDTVGTDGILEIWVDENTEAIQRVLKIYIFGEHNPSEQGFLEIRQKGAGDDSDNVSGDIMNDYRVGWGINAYDEFKSSKSIRGQVFNLNEMALLDSADVFQSVQECIRAKSEFKCVSAKSERELSSLLTKEQDISSNFLGVKKTMHRYSKISKHMSSQQYCSYARLTKIVATRSIDAGAISYIVEKMPAEKIPFTPEFRKIYDKLNDPGCPARDKLITDMLDNYGTHIVISADAGGMIDYAGAFDRNKTSELEAVATEQSYRVFRKSNKSISKSLRECIISDISNSASIDIKGGDAGMRNRLSQSIMQLDSLGVIPDSELNEWFATISYSNKENLDLVDFKVMPIWLLFSNQTLSRQIMQKVFEMQRQSNNIIPDQELGTDNYEISLNDDRLDFRNTADANTSLVKIYYVKKVPVLEICEEYVPKIRSDKRVKILYPIYNGKTNHSQGMFLGDGEGNRPAQVSFFKGDCYVKPIEDYGTKDIIDRVYYIHGNLYEKNYGNACQQPTYNKVVDEVVQFANWPESYAVVKIGSGYWTRKYITRGMDFGVGSGRFKIRERIVDGLLYADIYENNKKSFTDVNAGIYGQDTESYSKMQMLWYLPLSRNLNETIKYLGGNMKTLFKGQASGFEAQFEGYYGSYDEQGRDNNQTKLWNKGIKCYVPFKNGTTTSDGIVMVLTSNYRWEQIVTSSGFNYYPVRLYRTSYFTHKKI